MDAVLAAQFKAMAQEFGQIRELRTELHDLRMLVEALTGMVEGLVANHRARDGGREPGVTPSEQHRASAKDADEPGTADDQRVPETAEPVPPALQRLDRYGRLLEIRHSCTGGMKLNTSELVERIAAEHGVSKDHTRDIIESMLAAVTAPTSGGDEVNLTGFGRFKAADRAARSGRNPCHRGDDGNSGLKKAHLLTRQGGA